MARSRGGSSARAPARPAARTAPPPAPRAAAPPPATHHNAPSGGGMMSGLAGMVMQGAAMGTGSAMAHRAVDSVMGPRTIHTEAAPSANASTVDAPVGNNNPCAVQSKSLMACLESGNDMGACQFYMDSLRSCRINAGLQQ